MISFPQIKFHWHDYFIYELKIQYVYKIIVLGLKMMVKSRENVFFETLYSSFFRLTDLLHKKLGFLP
jgi:hypothetical protein